jgi:hypothetical protein
VVIIDKGESFIIEYISFVLKEAISRVRPALAYIVIIATIKVIIKIFIKHSTTQKVKEFVKLTKTKPEEWSETC